jgi:hypothetical protein
MVVTLLDRTHYVTSPCFTGKRTARALFTGRMPSSLETGTTMRPASLIAPPCCLNAPVERIPC